MDNIDYTLKMLQDRLEELVKLEQMKSEMNRITICWNESSFGIDFSKCDMKKVTMLEVVGALDCARTDILNTLLDQSL